MGILEDFPVEYKRNSFINLSMEAQLRTDRSEVGDGEMSAENFKDISTRGAVDVDTEAHSLLNDDNFQRIDAHLAEFRRQVQGAFLGN